MKTTCKSKGFLCIAEDDYDGSPAAKRSKKGGNEYSLAKSVVRDVFGDPEDPKNYPCDDNYGNIP